MAYNVWRPTIRKPRERAESESEIDDGTEDEEIDEGVRMLLDNGMKRRRLYADGEQSFSANLSSRVLFLRQCESGVERKMNVCGCQGVARCGDYFGAMNDGHLLAP